MTKGHSSAAYRIFTASVLCLCAAYALYYFDYFQTPSGDFIGQHRVLALRYMAGDFPGTSYKFLPLFPLLVAGVAAVNPLSARDPVYLSAQIINITLLVPYLILTYLVYRRFLGRRLSLAALTALGANIYTVFTAVNAELEMLLSLLVVFTMWSAARGSRLSYLGAFLAASTKWDSVFAVPAAMFRDFFRDGRRVRALLLGLLASSGVAAWFALSLVNAPDQAHPYVREIASRGPNIYRFPADCFLTLTGFIPAMISHAWYSGRLVLQLPLIAAAALGGAALLVLFLYGTVRFIREHREEAASMLIFLAGFFIVHMVYQNSKERYVLPVLWLLNMFLFYGASAALRRLKARVAAAGDNGGVLPDAAWFAVSLVICAAATAAVVMVNTPAHLAFALAFSGAFYLSVRSGAGDSGRVRRYALALSAAALFMTIVFYGVRTMDYYSLQRVEFKKAALWFRENAAPGDVMLITEKNVAVYYSGFENSRFVTTGKLRAESLSGAVSELASMGVKYVFVDDYYIRRYAWGDKNAVDRKAYLMKEIRDGGPGSGHFRPVASFETGAGIKSTMYRFEP